MKYYKKIVVGSHYPVGIIYPENYKEAGWSDIRGCVRNIPKNWIECTEEEYLKQENKILDYEIY